MKNYKNPVNLKLKESKFQSLFHKKVTFHNIKTLIRDIDQFYEDYHDFDLYSLLIDKVYNDYMLLFGQPLNLT